MNIIFKYNNDNVNFKEVLNILGEAFGGRKFDDEKLIQKSFINSSHVVYAYDNEKLIGFARAISDIEWAVIYNVALKPAYQGKGIGKEILKKLLENLGSKHIFTYTHPRTITLYEHLGFVRTKMAFKYSQEISEIDNLFFLPHGFKYENEFKYNHISNIEKNRNVDIKYSQDLKSTTIEDINKLLENAFGRERNIDLTREEFLSSDYYSFAFDKDKLIGCARLVTDGAKEGILLNLATDKNYQGLGIGINVVNNLCKQVEGYDIFIHANPKALGFYNNHKEFKRYKTAFCYINDREKENGDFHLPSGYRHPDEYNNKDIKYYKGKILN